MLAAAFLLGLVSSLHCIGMCGPIALMLPLDHHNPIRKITQLTAYQLGRLSSYASLGLLFGFLGRGFFLAGLQQNLSIVAGVLMILAVTIPERTFARYNFSKPIYKAISLVKSNLGKRLQNKSLPSLFLVGVFNGLLPCAMVYAALFGAVALQQPYASALFMVAFGLGTAPLMVAVPYFANLLTLRVRNKLKTLVPYAVCLLGVLFILRGAGLGVDYVSPSTPNLSVKQMPNCR
jgi:uncharacterized protein